MKRIEVKLMFDSGKVHLSVKDDGRGFDARQRKPGHYGLLNMHERASKIGGELVIDSAPGEGAQISFSIPVAA